MRESVLTPVLVSMVVTFVVIGEVRMPGCETARQGEGRRAVSVDVPQLTDCGRSPTFKTSEEKPRLSVAISLQSISSGFLQGSLEPGNPILRARRSKPVVPDPVISGPGRLRV